MAKQFNPFHSWLGIDERLGVPTHYQLLGVKPNVDDIDEFCERVERNHRSLNGKLQGMTSAEIGSHQKLHARLLAHVDKARKTLLDDQLRGDYLKTLREKVRQKKAARTKSSNSRPNGSGLDAKVEKAPPSKVRGENASLANATPIKKTRKVVARTDSNVFETETGGSQTFTQSSTATIKQKQSTTVSKTSVDAEKPSKTPAVPMAIPVKPAAERAAKQKDSVKPERSEARIGAEINQLESRARSEAVMIRSLRKQRKKSYLMPILLGCIALLGVAGLIGLFSGSDYELNLSEVAEQPSSEPDTKVTKATATPDVVASSEAPSKPNNDSAPGYDPSMGEMPVAKVENLPVAPKPSDSDISLPAATMDAAIEDDAQPVADLERDPAPDDPFMEADFEPLLVESADAGMVTEPADAGMVTEPADAGIDIEPITIADNSVEADDMHRDDAPDTLVELQPGLTEETPDPVFFPEAETQLNSDTIEFFISRARAEMKRGRTDSATEQLGIAERLLPQANSGNANSKANQAIGESIADARAVAAVLDGFWSQVVRSGRSYMGDDLQPAPGTIIGFVEGRESDVVVKIAGEVFAVPYRSLRPGLAMELASKGEGPDADQWNLQQAAFRVIHSSGSAKSSQSIEDLLSKVEEAGLSTDQLRRFWETGSDRPEVGDKLDRVPRAIKSMVKKLSEGKYTSIRRLDPKTARSTAIDFAAASYADANMRIAALDEAVKLATHAGDAALMLDLVDELGTHANIETGNMKAESFAAMGKRLPVGADPRTITEAFYEFVRSPDTADVKPVQLQRLKISMIDLAAQNRITDLKRLISQSIE